MIRESRRFRINGLDVTAYLGSPYVIIETWDGNEGHQSQRFDLAQQDGTNQYYQAKTPLIGSRIRVTVGGVGGDQVEELFLSVEPAPTGRGN